MDMGIRGRRALVTGAGRGLGEAIALSLAGEGAQVVAVSRTQSDLDRLVEAMGGESAGHRAFAHDLIDEAQTAALIEELAEVGPVDIVVHNVGGTLEITDPFCSVEDWRRVWRFNLEIAVELNRVLVPPMQSRGWGRVVHISSIASMENHGPVTYCSIKAALTAYARSLGRVVSPDNVIVTAVLPGAVMCAGGYWDQASRERPEHVERYLADRMASRRFGRPEEVSGLVTFLCGEHASFCVGSVVPVDGGQGRGYFGQ